jgi:hypothetical protein
MDELDGDCTGADLRERSRLQTRRPVENALPMSRSMVGMGRRRQLTPVARLGLRSLVAPVQAAENTESAVRCRDER